MINAIITNCLFLNKLKNYKVVLTNAMDILNDVMEISKGLEPRNVTMDLGINMQFIMVCNNIIT